MTVRIYQYDDYQGYSGYFPDPSRTPNLGNYSMGYTGYSWDNQVSSLYTSTTLYVFEAPYYFGTDKGYDFAELPPGRFTTAELALYGIDDNSMSSFFFYVPDPYAPPI
jgi:hypothetical protein